MERVKKLLFIDSQDDRLKVIDDIACKGWMVEHADSLEQAAEYVRDQYYDVGLMPLSSTTLAYQSKLESIFNKSNTEWVALVDATSLQNINICRLLRHLFYAYQILPGNSHQLDILLNHAAAMTQLLRNSALADSSHDQDEYEMVGTTPAMCELFQTIRKVGAVDAPVLIRGESGTGKELTARSIHERSSRTNAPFNAVNCAALPVNLVQSELFGHEKGSFTGASQRKIGRIESTAGGTLFLDEIGDLPLDMQVNLLRFLEGHYIQRVGSSMEIPVDVRVIAATHVDLEKAVREGRFREDLYHRLNVLQVKLPALRERPEDIELLAKFFFDKFIKEKNINVKGFSLEALTVMRQYAWPGNVRELINRIRRAMVMCENRLIRPEDLGIERRSPIRNIVTLEQARAYAEHKAIQAALARNNHNVQRAASDLGVTRVTLYRLLDKYKKIIAKQHMSERPIADMIEERQTIDYL